MRPFDLDRRHREKQRPREIALAPMPAWAIASSPAIAASARRSVEQNGATGMKSTVPAMWSAGRRSETRDAANAGLAGGELFPVVVLAGAERGDDADAGDRDDRPSGFVA